MTIAERMAEFVSGCDTKAMPAAVVAKAKACVLDWLGCALAGGDVAAARTVAELAVAQGGAAEATVAGYPAKVPALWAAFANGAISHAAEMDDGHKWSIMHPGVTTIPAALAVGERLGASGAELLAAVVAGYDVGLRVGTCAGKGHYAVWHTTATCGTFGAAAAAARMLRLEPAAVADALGNAGTQAAGLWQFLDDGAASKVLHPAKACFNGTLAAMLAASGLSGPRRIFEGERGFFRATAPGADLSGLTAGLGTSYKISESNFKVHSSCGHTHSVVDAAIALHGQAAANEVEAIRVWAYSESVALTANFRPRTTFEAKFSTPYCVAVALLYGEADESKFAAPLLDDAAIGRLMAKTSFAVGEGLDAGFPDKRPVVLEVMLRDGRVLRRENYFRRGDPENPLTYDEVVAKFRALTAGKVTPAAASLLVDKVGNLESLGSVAELAAHLARS